MMEESLLLAGLAAPHHQDRTKSLEDLRAGVRRASGQLRFRAQEKLYGLLSNLLKDANWNVRRETIDLLGDLVPPPDAQRHVAQALGPLVANCGDNKIAIRRATATTLEVSAAFLYFFLFF